MSLSAGENSDFSFIINPNYGILRAVIVRLHKKERKEGNSMALQTYEKEHLHRLRSLLPECTVLLKRDGRFPLDAPCEIALYGSGARRTIFGGTGSGEVNSRFRISIEKGLERFGFTITTKPWLDAFDQILADAKVRFIKEIKARARKNHRLAVMEGMGAVMPQPAYDLPLNGAGSTAIYVLSRISGEGNDRLNTEGDILLTASEIRDILALDRKYDRFMLVLNVGGPVDLSPVMSVGNILVLSQLGAATGVALADLLLGKTVPSGKLTTTWSAWEDYCSIGDFGEHDDTRYREGIYVGYRYFDSIGKKALFPFGYGLGYTDFTVSDVRTMLSGEDVTITARIENTGAFSGRETLQVYLSSPAGRLDQPWQSLAAFVKTDLLAPGESQTVEASFRLSECASYDSGQSCFVLEAGDYIVRAGTCSACTCPAAILRLENEITVSRHRPLDRTADFQDWKPDAPAACELPDDLPVLAVDPDCICCRNVAYDASPEIEPLVKTLTDEQLSTLCCGAYNPKGGMLSVIGNASSSVAGAAGESSHIAEALGFPAVVMADGPAGLRLSRDYIRDEHGAASLGLSLPETMADFLPKPVTMLMNLTQKKPKAGQEVLHQYCTAIPIGTAIAQSFNPDLAETCGDIVGTEMIRFGVHLWLAPALNIHRSIRCGRNFEYFSEDPLVSGIMAAAITNGVQRHPHCGTTIKHYCVNNQETNRFNSNSIVSERALREIYLKGFGICIRRSQPLALMTSYNLLNGVHTSESRDLIENVLRCDFGYQGMVMTDWVIAGMADKTSAHRGAAADEIVASGNDIVMPGSKQDDENIRKALADGRLGREQLEANASRLLKIARKLTTAE